MRREMVIECLKDEIREHKGFHNFFKTGLHYKSDILCSIEVNGVESDFAVYVIDKAPDLNDIKAQVQRNTSEDLYSLFVVDEDLLPMHGKIVHELPDWLQFIHDIHANRIYAYSEVQYKVKVFPMTLKFAGMDGDGGGFFPANVYYHAIHIDFRKIMLDRFFQHIGDNQGMWFYVQFKELRANGRNNRVKFSGFDESRKAEKENGSERKWRYYGGYDSNKERYDDSAKKERAERPTPPPDKGYINPMEEFGVSNMPSEKEVKARYRQLCKEWHPDISTKSNAEEMMKTINMQYTTIMALMGYK